MRCLPLFTRADGTPLTDRVKNLIATDVQAAKAARNAQFKTGAKSSNSKK